VFLCKEGAVVGVIHEICNSVKLHAVNNATKYMLDDGRPIQWAQTGSKPTVILGPRILCTSAGFFTPLV
jgi:hypothetical protein